MIAFFFETFRRISPPDRGSPHFPSTHPYQLRVFSCRPSNNRCHSNSSSFLSNRSSSPPPSTATDLASSTVAVAPSETRNSLDHLAASNSRYAAHIDQLESNQRSSLVPLPLHRSSPYRNVPRFLLYPSCRPSNGGSPSLSTQECVAEMVPSNSTPAFM